MLAHLAGSPQEVRDELLGNVVEQPARLQVVLAAIEQEFAAGILVCNERLQL